MSPSRIEWLARPGTIPESWNTLGGCSPCSAGCQNCYAARLAAGRLRHHPRYAGTAEMHNGKARWTGKINLDYKALDTPLGWRKPRTVFVASMSDLFHSSARVRYIASVLARIATTPQHTYLCLTKRAVRLYELFNSAEFVHYVQLKTRRTFATEIMWPLPNLWLGVTAENQAAADERIPLLLQTPAAVQFVSCEPLLGPIDLSYQLRRVNYTPLRNGGNPYTERFGLDWVIAGGETGPGARPMRPDWARELRDQCQAAGVPYFHKQNGVWLHASQLQDQPLLDVTKVATGEYFWDDGSTSYRVGKKAAGHLLDGQVIREWPTAKGNT